MTNNKATLQRYAPMFCSDEIHHAAFEMTEPASGCNIEDHCQYGRTIQTRAELIDGHWVINGQKIWASSTGNSEFYSTVCTTDPEKGDEGICIITVPKDTPGISFGKPEEKMGFILIVVIMFAVVVPIVVLTLGPHYIYMGMLDAATNPANPNYNPEALNFFAGAAWRYGVAAVVIALGQIVLDQGYYQRAVAAVTTKTLKRAYILGGFGAWLPIPFTCGIVFGSSALALQLTPEVTTQISPYIMSYVTGISGALVFLVMVFMAAMTTGDTAMAGLQASLTVDFYKGTLRPKATEKEQIRFGRLVIIPIGLAIAGLAMALEGVSLLYMLLSSEYVTPIYRHTF